MDLGSPRLLINFNPRENFLESGLGSERKGLLKMKRHEVRYVQRGGSRVKELLGFVVDIKPHLLAKFERDILGFSEAEIGDCSASCKQARYQEGKK